MDNETGEESPQVPSSPKPLAFTVDFGAGKSVDSQRHRNLMEKFQKKHRRGQSLSKLDEKPAPAPRTHPLTGNLPRKSSFQSSEGYFSSDEKSAAKKRLDLPLKNVNTVDTHTNPNMTQSYPTSAGLFDQDDLISGLQINDVSSPELDLISPFEAAKSPEIASSGEPPDDVSDAGTYTLDADNYSEEQKERMSIDRDFKIELISQAQKTEEYVKSLMQQQLPTYKNKIHQKLSPILSPTQNLSFIQADDQLEKTFTKIMFPRAVCAGNGLQPEADTGSVISVSSSGAFRSKNELRTRRLSLTKSEVHVEEYVDKSPPLKADYRRKLSANVINVQSIRVGADSEIDNQNIATLPPSVGGKGSPSKIPSPMHTLSRPRSRSGSQNLDLSDFETESYLKPTQNCINSLQKRLSLDSDTESTEAPTLNNTIILKSNSKHLRHNSLDDKISNKLEHFQTKNFQRGAVGDAYFANQQRITNKVQNSPNNSPIRRSSSFSTKYQASALTQVSNMAKNINILQDVRNSPGFVRNSSIQRSTSAANMQPLVRRGSIDRTAFGDTESSSEDDYHTNLAAKKKDLTNLTTTRYNRAFSLRRARLDEPANRCPNTPEMRRKFAPEPTQRAISMDRKVVNRNVEVQSRYLTSVAKKAVPSVAVVAPPSGRPKSARNSIGVSGIGGGKAKEVFSRTDSGRFSMKVANKAPNGQMGGGKTVKKDGNSGKKSSGRSNSSLSSREKEFQNWKRRKSYDPMKAAAEGKRKEQIAKKQNVMTQSYNENHQDCDSSPSRSSSVHRSQSFHGTAALEQLISSEEDDELTLSADEGFSPPTPSPCELSPARASLRNAWKDHVLH